jgi:AcrR family transcriptional regulator
LPTVRPPSSQRRPSRWAGLSPDDRRAGRRELLLDVAYELLGTEGWSGTTVRAVCTAARLNPRYFYESFADLDELLIAVYDRVIEELGREVLGAIAAAPDDARAQSRAAIESIVRFVDEDRRRARVLYIEALGNEALNHRRIETAHQVVSVVELVATERHGPPPPGEQIGRIGASILVGGTGELVVAWLEGRITVTREQLIDDATEMFIAVGETAARIAESRNPKRKR